MTHQFKAEKGRTVFIVSCNFKDLAIFKPKSWRDIKTPIDVDVVYYSIHDTNEGDSRGMMRVGGNYHLIDATVTANKLQISKR